MALGVGDRLGSLRIDEPLGEGRLGTAYRASHPEQGPVVVKLLHRLRAAGAPERFLALASRLAEVTHPNLAQVLEYGVHEDVPYLVVEAAGGVPLDLRFPVGPPPTAVALPILSAVAAALDHLHHLGLVHGGLAAHQVLLDDRDRPTVTDFGLWPLWAMAEGAGDAVADAAPELLAGAAPTAASDRYAFAVLAHRLLAGGPPPPVGPGQAAAQPDGLPPALGVEPEGRVGEALARGLEREPEARWESCGAMVGALRAAIAQDIPPLVITPPGEAEPGPTGWRRQGLVYGAGAVGVAAAIVLGRAVWSGPDVVAVGLSSSTVAPGQVVVVSAVNLPAEQSGTVVLHSQPVTLGSFRANAQGEVRVRVTIPRWTPPGQHHLALCWRGACQGDARLNVLALPSSPIPPPTPKAGISRTSSLPPPPAVQGAPPPTPAHQPRSTKTSTAHHSASAAPAPAPAPAPSSSTPPPTSTPPPPPTPPPPTSTPPPPTSTPTPPPPTSTPPPPTPTPSATASATSPGANAVAAE